MIGLNYPVIFGQYTKAVILCLWPVQPMPTESRIISIKNTGWATGPGCGRIGRRIYMVFWLWTAAVKSGGLVDGIGANGEAGLASN